MKVGRKQKFPKLSAEQAHAALRWLHATGKVGSSQIVAAVKRREQLVAEIRAQLERLGGEDLRFLHGPQGLERRATLRTPRKRISPAARAAWRAQGQYLGAVRRLSKTDRLKVRAIREKSGVRVAVAAARKLAKN